MLEEVSGQSAGREPLMLLHLLLLLLILLLLRLPPPSQPPLMLLLLEVTHAIRYLHLQYLTKAQLPPQAVAPSLIQTCRRRAA